MTNHKTGGLFAFVEGVIYIIGFVFLLAFMEPNLSKELTQLNKLEFILTHKTIFQLWHLIIYVLFGVILIPLVIAIKESFTNKSLLGTKVAPVFGFIWAGFVIASGMISNIGLNVLENQFLQDSETALTMWKTIAIVQGGLAGGVEVVGRLWVLLLSISAINEKLYSSAFNYLGLVVGTTGILTVIPGLEDLGAVFGITQIVWFIWIGLYLFRQK